MYSIPKKMILGSSPKPGFAGAMMLAFTIMLSLAGGRAAIAADTMAAQLADARQETQIWTTYALSSYLRATDLKVSVHNGKATLTGTVEDGVNRDLAKQIALGVSGITDVDNQIVIQQDYSPPAPPAERSYGERIDDATITAMVKSKLLWSTYTDGLTTDVDTLRGKVTLTGSADSAVAKELASKLADNTNGVVSVDNQLVIKQAKAADAPAQATEHESHVVSDAWISTKIKSTFIYSSNIHAGDIEVSTNNGAVTLTGRINSGAERELAIELAKNIRGVQSVESKGLTI